MSDALRAGTVWVNTYRAVSFMSPFGGYKRSGQGRESGQECIKEFLETKSVWISHETSTANPFIIKWIYFQVPMISKNDKIVLNGVLIFSILTLIIAYFIQYILKHEPCNLCLIERYPYIGAIILISFLLYISW